VAIVSVIGITVQDAYGDEKPLTSYIPGTVSLADIQTGVTALAPNLDAVIDPKILRAFVTIGLTLPGGLKSSAIAGQDVHNGALNSYSAANTAYRFSQYVPGWKLAGFNDKTVIDTGIYNTLIDQIASLYSDKDGNLLDAFLEGKKVRRK
jgi:hypothetical protein